MNQGAGRRVLMKKTACKKSHATVPLNRNHGGLNLVFCRDVGEGKKEDKKENFEQNGEEAK